jgi:hypothetical protein
MEWNPEGGNHLAHTLNPSHPVIGLPHPFFVCPQKRIVRDGGILVVFPPIPYVLWARVERLFVRKYWLPCGGGAGRGLTLTRREPAR